MDLRRAFFSRAMRLLDHDQVKRILADPRAIDAFVAIVRLKDRAVTAYRRCQRPGS